MRCINASLLSCLKFEVRICAYACLARSFTISSLLFTGENNCQFDTCQSYIRSRSQISLSKKCDPFWRHTPFENFKIAKHDCRVKCAVTRRVLAKTTAISELKQQRRQRRQRKRPLKTNICEMVTILWLSLLLRILYCWQRTQQRDWWKHRWSK